jgi:cobalamin biosynthesis protein CobT
MAQIDLEMLRERVRQMDFERGTPEQVALWREDVEEARANLAIEDMTPTIDEDAMFAMMLDEGVPPALMPSIILSLYKPGTRQIAA